MVGSDISGAPAKWLCSHRNNARVARLAKIYKPGIGRAISILEKSILYYRSALDHPAKIQKALFLKTLRILWKQGFIYATFLICLFIAARHPNFFIS